jgi:hypothetical protein
MAAQPQCTGLLARPILFQLDHPSAPREPSSDDLHFLWASSSSLSALYVDAVRAVVANENTSISAEELLRWSKWALAAADRIDSARSARFTGAFEN